MLRNSPMRSEPRSHPPGDRAGGARRSWYDAWCDAATGPAGFWRTTPTARHFRTASSTGLFADLITNLITDLITDASTGLPGTMPPIRRVLEIGAGEGRLLAGLQRRLPGHRLDGVDVRPAELPSGIGWHTGVWDVRNRRWSGAAADLLAGLDEPTLIICCEWLDDLPCPVVRATGQGWRERLAPVADPAAAAAAQEDTRAVDDRTADWLRRWWPLRPGSAAEAGHTRDDAWAALISALRPVGGAALMIDYGHLRSDRPAGGSLAAYADGRPLPPRPDPGVNLTAHVAVDAVAAAGERAGARTAFLIDQRTAVDRYAPAPSTADGAVPTLAELQRRSERHFLADVLGHHRWLLQTVALPAGGGVGQTA